MKNIFRNEERRFKRMDPWSGYNDNGSQVVPTSELLKWDMRIDKKGNVWCRRLDKERTVAIWCPVHQLKHHLTYLERQKKKEVLGI